MERFESYLNRSADSEGCCHEGGCCDDDKRLELTVGNRKN